MERLTYRKGAWYHVARRPSRKWTRLSTDRAEAERLWHQVERGNAGTFAAVIDDYLVALEDRDLAAVTKREYRRQAELLRVAFGGMAPAKIRPVHVAQYLDAGTKRVAANREVALLSAIFSWAMRRGLADSNPAAGVRRNRERPRSRYITPAEHLALKRVAGRLAPAIDLGYLLACRKRDMLAITWDDVGDLGVRVVQHKTGTAQVVAWSDWLRSTVAWLAADMRGPHLVHTESGKAYSTSGWDSAWRRLRARAGLEDCHWHDVRGTALADLERAATLEQARRLAGHRSITMTENYVRGRGLSELALPAG